MGAFFWGLFWLFLFRFRNNRIHGISISKRTLLHVSDLVSFQPEASRDRRGWPRRISGQKFPKRTRILSIPNKPHSFHSVHSAIGSRMNGMIFHSFRKRNSSQKNTYTVYSEYSFSGIVPKERALYFHEARALRHTSALSRYNARSLRHQYEHAQFRIHFIKEIKNLFLEQC